MHNNEAPITDELLSAWLDAELEPAQRAQVDAALAAQPALAARLQQLRLANELTRQHAAAIDQRPLRPALQALLAAAPATTGEAPALMLPLRARLVRQLRQGNSALALAASLVLALGLGVVVMSRGDSAAEQAFALQAALLEEVASGDTLQVGDTRLSPRFSFRATDGNWCRLYHVDEQDQGSDNIACREDGQWTLQSSLPAAPQDSGLYVPATSATEALDAELDRLMQGSPLSQDTEARLLRKGWTSSD